jgi:hypothetical protein
MEFKYITKAIQLLKPNAQYSFTDNDYSTIKWDVLDGDAPSLQDIEAAIVEIKLNEAKAETDKAAARAALLNKLGITEDEALLLLS